MACVSLSSPIFSPRQSIVPFGLNSANRRGICLSPIGFAPIKKNRRARVSVCRADSVVFRNLDADDFRHPLDKQNTRILRAIPWLNELGKALLGWAPPSSYRYEASSVALRRSLVETPSNICTIRAKATITLELSLFSKVGGVTAPEFEPGVTIGSDCEACQGTKSNLHDEASFDSSHAQDKTLTVTTRAASGQNPGRLPPGGGDDRDITIQRLQTQLTGMTQILVDNKLMKPAQAVEARPFEDTTKGPNPPSRAGRNGRQRRSRISLDSQNDSKSVALSKRRVSPSRTPSSTDLREIFNAKRNRGGNLRDNLTNRTAVASGKDIILAGFTLYDGKSDPRSCISHVRQMTALWNHLDALMCQVFLSSLGDLGLKWFDRLPSRSIGNLHQLTESFVARFVINTKEGQELTVASYKLGLTLGEGICENLMLNPLADLWDLMSRIEMFARLEDDVRQAERNTDSTPRGEGQLRRRKEGSADHENKARRWINVVFKEPIYKLLDRI
ncbi:peptidase family M48 family protein [Actinidia rufa]|uniref:Peptidase family M48 family protein n=1 Tax=Actinidia rufa TaxID=165716 RepID=A0A7J0ELZ5_9ERIC|nr:peptidase family M48 family protein [Actinidia rufa]